MTVCIAAKCQQEGEPRVVLCCDWLSGDDYGSSETCDKLGKIAEGWFVLIASTVHKADEVIGWYEKKMSGLEIAPEKALDEVRRIARELKEKLRDEQSRLLYGFTVPELVAQKLYSRKEMEEISASVNFGAELLISTIIDNEPFIFEIRPDGEVLQQPDFGVIGTIEQAAAFMQWRCTTSGNDLSVVLHEVLEAKRFGEMAGEVGRDVSIYVLHPVEGLREVKQSHIKRMDQFRRAQDRDRVELKFNPACLTKRKIRF
jgi:hypothetical protein